MAKKIVNKSLKKVSTNSAESEKVCKSCHECNYCMGLTFIAGIILIILSWVFVSITWVKWTFIVLGLILILKKWCPCKKNKI